MKTVLLASDGSDNSLRAVREALGLWNTGNLHVRLLNVQEPVHLKEVVFRDRLSDMREFEKAREEAGLQVLAPARALLEQAGVMCDAHALIGNPAEVIARFAREYHCEMIVMGTRGLGTIRNLALGSVASKVVHLTELPVLLVK